MSSHRASKDSSHFSPSSAFGVEKAREFHFQAKPFLTVKDDLEDQFEDLHFKSKRKVRALEDQLEDTTCEKESAVTELEEKLSAATSMNRRLTIELEGLQAKDQDLELKKRAFELKAREDCRQADDLWMHLNGANSRTRELEARENEDHHYQSKMDDRCAHLVQLVRDLLRFRRSVREGHVPQEGSASPFEELRMGGSDVPIDTNFDKTPTSNDLLAGIDESVLGQLTIKSRSVTSYGIDSAPSELDADSDAAPSVLQSTPIIRKKLSKSQRKKARKPKAAEGQGHGRRSENRRKKIEEAAVARGKVTRLIIPE
ncbi:MAG: hypothetical protein Q9212_002619 [Teloschistes hypoglaucus]